MDFVPALALVISAVKVIFMWLNYRDCKRSRDTSSQKNTD